MKSKICEYLSENIGQLSIEEFLQLLETPPDEKMGDYAIPCYTLAKKLRKNPASQPPVSYRKQRMNKVQSRLPAEQKLPHKQPAMPVDLYL